MSRTSSAAAALFVALLLAVRPAAAQAPVGTWTPLPETLERERALQKQLRELLPRLRAATDEAQRIQDAIWEAQRAESAQDTLMVGPLRVVTTTDQVQGAEWMWQAEWAFFEPILGASSSALEPVAFTHHRKATPYRYQTGGPTESVEFRRPATDAQVRGAIHAAIGKAALRALPYELVQWTGNTGLDATMVPARTYRRFVASPSALAQSCATGSNDACWTALGQVDPGVDLVSTWYTPAEQRAVVRHRLRNRMVSGPDRACLDGSDVACHELLEQTIRQQIDTPYLAGLRAHLLWFALQQGGAGSVERLNASVEATRRRMGTTSRARDDAGALLGPITEIRAHLEKASGLDGDVLIERWRAKVLAGRPGPIASDERARASTLLWVMLFTGLAARSKRWRLG